MRKFLSSWRARTVTVAIAGVTAFALSSCSPPPIMHSIAVGINEHNSTGAGDNHLHVTMNITVDSCGNVTGATGVQSVSQYGFLNAFGDVDKVVPVGARGNTGSSWAPCIKGWENSMQYAFETYWDVQLGYTVGGIGYAGDKGICSAIWPLIITSGGGEVDSTVIVDLSHVRTQCHNGFYLSYAT